MLFIRNATIADIPLIRDLTMQIWPQTYIPILSVPQVEYMLDLMYNPAALQQQMEEGQQFLICYDDDIPVAFASYSLVEDDVYKLHKIYILPDQQRKGIGRFIIRHVVQAIMPLHATALHLNVNKYNYSAQAFYERLGFRHYKAEDIDIGNGYYMNDFVLALPIDPNKNSDLA